MSRILLCWMEPSLLLSTTILCPHDFYLRITCFAIQPTTTRQAFPQLTQSTHVYFSDYTAAWQTRVLTLLHTAMMNLHSLACQQPCCHFVAVLCCLTVTAVACCDRSPARCQISAPTLCGAELGVTTLREDVIRSGGTTFGLSQRTFFLRTCHACEKPVHTLHYQPPSLKMSFWRFSGDSGD